MTKVLGGVLLVIGTSIGAAMLALPVVAAAAGFWNSIFLLIAAWAIMTFCALLTLEANLWLPQNSNLISMGKELLGRYGQAITWLTYLLLFYALLAAYSGGGASIIQGSLEFLINKIKIDAFIHRESAGSAISIPSWLASLLFITLFGFIIYKGIKAVDHTNRLLMAVKLVAFILLVFIAIPHIHLVSLPAPSLAGTWGAIIIMVTSFGYGIIIPSLRSYFRDDIKKLRQVILIGSSIPLFIYSLWIFIVHGLIPNEGAMSLASIASADDSTKAFTEALFHYLKDYPWISVVIAIFAGASLITSFLGVALSVSDFLADGLHVKKVGLGNVIVYGATFAPPLVILFFYPNAFIGALKYAGIFATILHIVLPLLMVWVGRYYYQKAATSYRVVGGKFSLIICAIFGLAILSAGIWEVI